jgi:hypothetical protein
MIRWLKARDLARNDRRLIIVKWLKRLEFLMTNVGPLNRRFWSEECLSQLYSTTADILAERNPLGYGF